MFTVNTTYVTLEEAYLHSAPGVWDADNPPADISFTKKGDIIISVKKDAIPGTYVIAAVPKTEQGVHKLPAYMKIEVARSINELEIKAPLSIFKQEGKKAVFKTEIVYNNGIEYFMPKTKKVTYTLYDDKGKEITKDHTLYGMITIKNGKVTLHKNYNPKEALIFTIEASAADYKENEVKATAAVLVQRVPISMEKACIVKKIGENKYAPITVDQATGNVLARELHQSRIVVLKNHVSDNSVYTEEDFMENNFTFKSSKGKAEKWKTVL